MLKFTNEKYHSLKYILNPSGHKHISNLYEKLFLFLRALNETISITLNIFILPAFLTI